MKKHMVCSESNDIDLIILDVMMPKMDMDGKPAGRLERFLRFQIIILLTAKSEESDEVAWF